MCLNPTSSVSSATSSVEELPGIFSGECKVPRNTAQQLYDVGYVVYGGEREVGGGGKRAGRKKDDDKRKERGKETQTEKDRKRR